MHEERGRARARDPTWRHGVDEQPMCSVAQVAVADAAHLVRVRVRVRAEARARAGVIE